MERPSPTIEDYLGAIYTLQRDGQEVRGSVLAEWMEVTPPTVTATVHRMERDGWVTMAKDKTIDLTEAGRKIAASVVRRHMLTELLLARVLGTSWSRVHKEADLLEHGLSQETAERVANMVRESHTCPHGNPLPGYEELLDENEHILTVPAGREYLLARIGEEAERDDELMAFLEAHCLIPGASVTVKEVNDLAETVLVASCDRETVLAFSIARHLWVRPK